MQLATSGLKGRSLWFSLSSNPLSKYFSEFYRWHDIRLEREPKFEFKIQFKYDLLDECFECPDEAQ